MTQGEKLAELGQRLINAVMVDWHYEQIERNGPMSAEHRTAYADKSLLCAEYAAERARIIAESR